MIFATGTCINDEDFESQHIYNSIYSIFSSVTFIIYLVYSSLYLTSYTLDIIESVWGMTLNNYISSKKTHKVKEQRMHCCSSSHIHSDALHRDKQNLTSLQV